MADISIRSDEQPYSSYLLFLIVRFFERVVMLFAALENCFISDRIFFYHDSFEWFRLHKTNTVLFDYKETIQPAFVFFSIVDVTENFRNKLSMRQNVSVCT